MLGGSWGLGVGEILGFRVLGGSSGLGVLGGSWGFGVFRVPLRTFVMVGLQGFVCRDPRVDVPKKNRSHPTPAVQSIYRSQSISQNQFCQVQKHEEKARKAFRLTAAGDWASGTDFGAVWRVEQRDQQS